MTEWAVLEIAKDPERQDRLYQEFHSVSGSEKMAEEHWPQLPYLNAIFYETLREHSPVPIIPLRYVHEDTQIGGYHVPAGSEVIQHGACLGLGLAALGTADEDIVEDIKNVLYTDSAVAGEAAGIAMGLPMVGTSHDKASEMLTYAHETQLKKIMRGIALGIALTGYGREEAGTLIE